MDKRLALVEMILLWEGHLTAKQLQLYYEITRPTAQKLIEQYKQTYPDNTFYYDASLKCHVPSGEFKALLSSGDLNEYQHYLSASVKQEPTANTISSIYHHLPLPKRNTSPKLVRHVIQACRKQQKIDIGYYSIKSGDIEARIISPHTLVNDGVRFHVRAYCEKNKQYRDFVLSRFHDEIEECAYKQAEFTQKDDSEWNTWLDIVLQPDPRLSTNKRKAIEMDYLMKEGKLIIPCRAALIKYLLQHLHLNALHQHPEGQQIIVESQCWQAIKPYRMS